MKSRFFAMAAAAATLFAANSASALVHLTNATFAQFQFGVNAGETLVTQFESSLPGAVQGLGGLLYEPGVTGYSLTGTSGAKLVTTWDGDGAPPATGTNPAQHDGTRYLTVLGGNTATLLTPLLRQISFYVGSIDGYNSMRIYYADNTSDLVDGSWVSNNTIADAATGNQYTGGTNGRLTLHFDEKVTRIDFMSSTNSFEISNIGAIVPEPATWALMIVGFGLMGSAVRSQRKRSLALAA